MRLILSHLIHLLITTAFGFWSVKVWGARLMLPIVCAVVLADSAIVPCETQKLLPTIGAAQAHAFGWSVAVSGNTVVIGVKDYDHPNGFAAGGAYVFVRSGTSWTYQSRLFASDAAAWDFFGHSVAISGDTVVVGAYQDDNAGGMDAGAAYVFVRNGTTWTQQAKLTASDGAAEDQYGHSVAIHGDTALIGAYTDDNAGGVNAGAGYVCVRTGNAWSEQSKLVAVDGLENAFFGHAVAIEGDTALIGAAQDDNVGGNSAGAAYVFVRNGNIWSEQAKMLAMDGFVSDVFGYSVAIDGDYALIGAFAADTDGGLNAGAAYVFHRIGTVWTQQAKLTASDGEKGDAFGWSSAINGDLAMVGSNAGGDGVVYVFGRNVSNWTQRTSLTTSIAVQGDQFGRSVACSEDTLIVGAPSGSGDAAYAFLLDMVPDCNSNGIADSCDIHSGSSLDSNADGVPDECQCLSDITGDGSVGVPDLLGIINAWGPCASCAEDIAPPGGDGNVGVPDLLEVINNWGECP